MDAPDESMLNKVKEDYNTALGEGYRIARLEILHRIEEMEARGNTNTEIVAHLIEWLRAPAPSTGMPQSLHKPSV